MCFNCNKGEKKKEHIKWKKSVCGGRRGGGVTKMKWHAGGGGRGGGGGGVWGWGGGGLLQSLTSPHLTPFLLYSF